MSKMCYWKLRFTDLMLSACLHKRHEVGLGVVKLSWYHIVMFRNSLLSSTSKCVYTLILIKESCKIFLLKMIQF